MLISMPTGTSTIFGAFQAILALLANGTISARIHISYLARKSSPVKSFSPKSLKNLVAVQKRRPGSGAEPGEIEVFH
jgi:hypothetical protein